MKTSKIMSITAGRQMLDLLRLCYQARRPLMLEAGPGVGKSAIVRQFAEENQIGYICRDLSLLEPADLVGLPKAVRGKMHYNPPAFLPTRGKGVMVLEEINRAPQYMRAPCLQLLTERSLNDYRVPDQWMLVACVNPADGDDDYEVADLDLAYLSPAPWNGSRIAG